MNKNINDKDNLNNTIYVSNYIFDKKIIYGIFHTILSFFSLYLSFRCNDNKFNLIAFILAFCCPHIYIIYQLAFHGACGIFNDKSNDTYNA